MHSAARIRSFTAFLLSLCSICACDVPNSKTSTSGTYDIEGPQGIERSLGPWLVRVAAPALYDLKDLQLKVSEVVMGPLAESLADNQEPAVMTTSDLLSISLIETGRPDIYLALIPQLPLNQEYEYALWYDEVQLSEFHRFRPLPFSREIERTDQRECLAILE